MPTFEQNFSFEKSPFEQYVAENEPDILSYAVIPPYFEVAKKRAFTPSTHILFGARGSGKSATRLSTERELWKRHADGEKVPIAVPLIDFSRLLEKISLKDVSSDLLIKELAFNFIEILLLWISDQEEENDIIELLQEDELKLFVTIAYSFYCNVPESARKISQDRAMRLLRQNWKSKKTYWINQKWSKISNLICKTTSILLNKYDNNADISEEVVSLIDSNGELISGAMVLSKIVEIARVFGFSGVSVFVDKVDEHPKTQSSPDSAAQLVYPLLSHVQLMEVEGLGWQFFLWDRTRKCLTEGPLSVRLDKIAHSEVTWTDDFLHKMINSRIEYFSKSKIKHFCDLANCNFCCKTKLQELIELAVRSPREIVRLLDTVVREFDSQHANKTERVLLSEEDIDAGMDKYVSDIVWITYDRGILSQIIRLNMNVFINKDVQRAFKISPPAATNRIVKWEQSGAISLSGKRDAEGGIGGKPSNEYSILDPRITRITQRKLYDEKLLTESMTDMGVENE